MAIVNVATGTRIDEVDDQLFRISTPVENVPGGFSFNQYLLIDDEPLLFHTGPRGLFESVRAAIAHVMPVERLRWLAFSHVEADECGALNALLAAAPKAQPLCSSIAAIVQMNDLADRAPRALQDGETLSTGKRTLRWLDTPHLPHGWECGYLFDATARVLFCGDLFTQPGLGQTPVTEADVLAPSEAFRAQMDYFSYSRRTPELIEKVAATSPRLLACMHGAAWRGDGASALRALGAALQT
jgi:flavorubredoxin